MSLIISDTGAMRLPDALVNSGWVTNIKPSGQQAEPTTVGEKIQFSPPNFDRVDLSKAVSLDDKMVPCGVQNEARQTEAVQHGTGTEIEQREISQMQDADGSFNFSLPEDAAQRNVDIWEGHTKEIVISLSPEGKHYQAIRQMTKEWNAFVEQLKSSINGSGMDYFESQRFVKESFTSLYTDWMHNKPELFKVLFDQEKDHFANREWNLIAKPEGWTDADFEFWENYDPWTESK